MNLKNFLKKIAPASFFALDAAAALTDNPALNAADELAHAVKQRKGFDAALIVLHGTIKNPKKSADMDRKLLALRDAINSNIGQ